jgi:hypothetical protein
VIYSEAAAPDGAWEFSGAGFYKDAAPTALPKIAQPFKAGFPVGLKVKPRRGGRKFFRPLTELEILRHSNPRLKPWAIFKSR